MVKIVSLRAEGFRRLGLHEPLAFPDGLTVIQGRNEAGKSTVLEAILFGLYGDFRIPAELRGGRQGLGSLVNHRSSRARVELVFELGGKRYRVERIVEGGGEGGRQIDAKLVELGSAGGRLLASGVSKVNEMVQKLLRVSWREMLATNVIAQKDLERLLRMDKGDRERIINMMMGFESYNKAIEKLSEEVRDLRRSLEGARVEEKALAEKVEELEGEARKLGEWKTRLQVLGERIPQLELAVSRERTAYEYLVELEAALRRRRELKLQLDSTRRERVELAGKLGEARERRERMLRELECLHKEKLELGPLAEQAERELSNAEGKVRRLLEVRVEVEELWRSYRLTEHELESLRSRISDLAGKVRERGSLEAERERVRASLAALEGAKGAIHLPPWCVAGAVFTGVASIILGLIFHPAALAALSFAPLLLLAGLQSKHRRLQALEEKISDLKGKILSLDAELYKVKKDEEELNALRERERSLVERLSEARDRLVAAAERVGFKGGPEGLASSVAELLKVAEAEKAEASRKWSELSERLSKIEKELSRLDTAVKMLEAEIESAEKKVEELASSERMLEEELSRVVVREPPFEIGGMPWPPAEEDLEGVSAIRLEQEGRYRRAEVELERVKSEAEGLRKQIGETEERLQQLPDLRARLDEVRKKIQEVEVELRAREIAMDALKKVAERLRAAFAPSVEGNMSWIISYITNGRYKAVRIDPQTYDVEVYDAEAGRWMRRDIYSGGTNDQFLFAMRIAFILSLLPAAKGTYPKFLFLDEPLGSSDSERRSRIVELLSRELTRLFDQVLLITHVDVDEPPGSTIIVMSDGRPERVYRAGAVEAE